MSNRVSNFKVETSKDVEQDTEIDTLTTTLNNLVVPIPSTISPNIINLGGEGGVQIKSTGGDLQLGIVMDNSVTTWMNTKLNCSDLTATAIKVNGYLECASDCSFSDGVLTTIQGENSIISYTNASISGINEITCNKLNYTTLDPPIANNSLLTYYVDGSCGSDSYDGSILHPFKTIQKAITVCESVYNGTAREIKVAFGSYSETLTITKARIKISGSHESKFANVASNITGNILIQIAGSVDLFNSQVMITGFQIVGRVLDNSTSVHTLNIKDCYLYGVDKMVFQNSSSDTRTYLENLTIQASANTGTESLIKMNSGGLYMSMCSLTASSANTNCLSIEGSSSIYSMALNTFTNDNAGSSLVPLVFISTSSSASQVFGNCAFVFSSTTPKSTSTGNYNMAIKIFSTSLTLINNSFFLTGSTASMNAVLAYGGVYHYNNCASTAYLISAAIKGALPSLS
jgi:hypothetical protein